MKKFWRSRFFLVSLAFVSCVPRLALKEGARPEELGICLAFSSGIPPEVREAFTETLAEYVNAHNAGSHLSKLGLCHEPRNANVTLHFKMTDLIPPSTQALGVLVTVAGIAIPVVSIAGGAPIYITFAYLPNNRSIVDVDLSADIRAEKSARSRRVFSSNPYFGGLEWQRFRHAQAFERFLDRLISEIGL